VDTLLIIAEVALVLAGMTAPLLLEEPPTRRALLIGLGAAVVTTAMLWAGASTVWILGLWTIGVPGWLPGIVYALAFGGLVTTWWSAFGGGRWNIGVGLVLLAAGGVGAISTYQSGLVLVGVLLVSEVVARPMVRSVTASEVYVTPTLANGILREMTSEESVDRFDKPHTAGRGDPSIETPDF
jgi:hypothetical protein